MQYTRCRSCFSSPRKCVLTHSDAEISSLPVYVVEDHNEVLFYIYRAIGSKKLPFLCGAIVHFDAHPDMMIPQKFDQSKVYDKEYVLSSVGIESWIMPAVLAKHLSAVAWVKPYWSLQISDGIHRFRIGRHRISNEVKVTCPQSYFVGELAWAQETDLENITDVHLEVLTLNSIEMSSTCRSGEQNVKESSSHEQSEQKFLSDTFLRYLQPTSYVLDIDLDFFSTCNPFLELYTSEQLRFLSGFCHYEHPSDTENESALEEATLKRQQQASKLEALFAEIGESSNKTSAHLQLEQVIQGLNSSDCPVDPALLLSTGCVCKDCALPHYVSSREEICKLIDLSRKFLLSLPKPCIVTVSRSSRDGYCPDSDVDFIQEQVLDILKSIYGSIDVHLDYDDGDDAVKTESSQ